MQTQERKHAKDELAAASLRRLLAARGLSNAWLAEKCSVDEPTMRAEVQRGVATVVLRYRIEKALDFPLVLWSSANEIEVRKRCMREFGVDVRALGLVELKAFCRERGTGHPVVRSRENWFQGLVRWCGKNIERRGAA